MELKKCADRSFKNRVDTEADKPFQLPAVKLSDGKKAEDYMPAIKALFASLMEAEESTDDQLYSICFSGLDIGYVRLVGISTKTPEIQIALLPDFWGRGIALDVMNYALPKFREEYNPDYFIWHANANNKASTNLAINVGGALDEEATEAVGGIVETYRIP